jgi:hypothetical protein
MKVIRKTLIVLLGLAVLGSVSLADPGAGDGGPWKPCAKCRVVSPSAPIAP